jgi:hypothetical protein
MSFSFQGLVILIGSTAFRERDALQMNRYILEMRMPQQNMLKGLNEDVRGMKDPGAALIIIYVCVVFFLLLFAGLESARAADLGGTEEKILMMDNAHQVESLVSAHEQRGLTAEPVFSKDAKISDSGMTAKTAPSSEVFPGLGCLLLLLALFLAKDGKKR